MDPDSIVRIIDGIDSSLAVFDGYKGRLMPHEIRTQSMLSALRLNLLEQLAKSRDLRGSGAEAEGGEEG